MESCQRAIKWILKSHAATGEPIRRAWSAMPYGEEELTRLEEELLLAIAAMLEGEEDWLRPPGSWWCHRRIAGPSAAGPFWMLPLTLGLRLIEAALDPELVPLLGDQLACHLDQGTFAHAEHLTQRCGSWTQNLHHQHQRVWTVEAA